MSDREIMNAKNGVGAITNIERVTNVELGKWVIQTMDIYAEEMFGEFGYDTCTNKEKLQITISMLEDGMFNDL